MEISTALGAVTEARGIVGGLIGRWAAAKNAKLDAKALVRLLLLEARRNLELIDAGLRAEEDGSDTVLWEVTALLHVEVVETILGQGEISAKAFADVRTLKLTDPEDGRDGADLLTSLYVRVTSLQSIAVLNSQSPLRRVRTKVRLKNMRDDFLRLVQALPKAGKG